MSTTTRTASTASTVLHLLAASTMGALAASILFFFKIGPVVLTLSATHGIHSGDMLALVPALTGAWLARRALVPAR